MLLCGCSGSLSLENSDIMRPPRATGDRAEIQEVIDETAGSGYTLKYPQSGDYRSAIIMYDITGDGEEEALAVYRTSAEEAETHIILIDEINGKWSLAGDFKNSSPEVSQIAFADLNGDAAKEILVGFSNYSSQLSSLAVYSYNGMSAQSVTVDETYSSFIVGEFTGNQVQELMLISLSNNDTAASANLMYYSSDALTLTRRASVEMDSGVARFTGISYCQISDGVFGIAADGQGVDNSYYTQLIYFDQITGQLQNSLYTAVNDNKSMHRQDNLLCEDIDGDGIIEIPVSAKMPYDAANEIEDLVATEVIYNKYNATKNEFTEEYRYIANFDYGYFYKIPEEMLGKITARIDPSAGTMSVFALLPNSREGEPANQKGTLMFTVKAFDSAQWEQNAENGEYTKLMNAGSYVLAFAVPEGNPAGISRRSIINALLIPD